MQSIETKTLGATTHRGERIRARMNFGTESITIGYDYGLDWKENHQNAARKLMHKLEWRGEMHGGTTRNGMAWVFVNESSLCISG